MDAPPTMNFDMQKKRAQHSIVDFGNSMGGVAFCMIHKNQESISMYSVHISQGRTVHLVVYVQKP